MQIIKNYGMFAAGGAFMLTQEKKIMVKNATHRKLDSYKSRFSFKIRQHGKQQLSLQYKVSRILYKILGTP